MTLGCIPTGGYVSFKGMIAAEEREHEGFHSLPFFWRIATVLAGPIVVLLFSSCCIGPLHAAHSLIAGFRQLVMGSFAPLSYGQFLMSKLVSLSHAGSFLTMSGILAAKMAALNLLPVPTMNGGQFIIELCPETVHRRISSCRLPGLLLTAFLFIGWTVAICKYAYVALRLR